MADSGFRVPTSHGLPTGPMNSSAEMGYFVAISTAVGGAIGAATGAVYGYFTAPTTPLAPVDTPAMRAKHLARAWSWVTSPLTHPAQKAISAMGIEPTPFEHNVARQAAQQFYDLVDQGVRVPRGISGIRNNIALEQAAASGKAARSLQAENLTNALRNLTIIGTNSAIALRAAGAGATSVAGPGALAVGVATAFGGDTTPGAPSRHAANHAPPPVIEPFGPPTQTDPVYNPHWPPPIVSPFKMEIRLERGPKLNDEVEPSQLPKALVTDVFGWGLAPMTGTFTGLTILTNAFQLSDPLSTGFALGFHGAATGVAPPSSNFSGWDDGGMPGQGTATGIGVAGAVGDGPAGGPGGQAP
jgi:hypothetical protein